MILNPNDTKDLFYFHQNGTSPMEIWYTTAVSTLAPGTGSQAINTLRAIPFISESGGLIDTISFEITTGGAAGSVGRCGIYEATSETSTYPKNLVVDGGEFDCTTIGVKSASVSVYLKPGTLYWLAVLVGTNAATFRLQGTTSTPPPVMGIAATFGSTVRAGLTVSKTYGALPDPFTAGAAFATGGTAMVSVHYA